MITSYEQMPVGIYERLTEIAEQEHETDAQNLAVVAVLTGLTEDQVLDEPIGTFREQMDAAGFLLVLPRPAKLREHYVLKGVTYKPTTREDKMTAGQYIDFQTYAGMKGDQWAGILSCVLVPEGKTYNNGYDLADVQDAIRSELCILDAIALRAFFLTASRVSTAATLRCSALKHAKKGAMPLKARMQMKLAMLRGEAALRRAGGGFRALTEWLKLPEVLGTP